MNSDVIEANRRVHSSLILSGEYQKSPHRSPQSVRRVCSLLSRLHDLSDSPMHLDIGCGDGFVFECTPSHWTSHGIDATPEMLHACAENHPKVLLREGVAEELPFDDASFDVVTCYSFLDHLESTQRFYAEAIRVLKPNGAFYFGLSPNRDFFASLRRASETELTENLKTWIDIPLELQKAFDDGTYYETNFGIGREDLLRCEPGKSLRHGLAPLEELAKLEALGIPQIRIHYEWIVQENRLDPTLVKTIRDFIPFTSPCFKYFDLLGRK